MSSVFVISDLHLGGRPHNNSLNKPGSSICTDYERLAGFIDWLTSGDAAEGAVELILNGDIVDFLLDDDYADGLKPLAWTPNQDEVLIKLKKIIERTRENNQNSPFDALQRFCNVALEKNYSLVLILGNHDIELALPKVRDYLLNEIFSADTARVRFIFDGEAYTRGDLLVEHGNRYDRFNIIDHSGLRQERSAMSRGMSLEHRPSDDQYEPPAGSIMVTEIFNPLKEQFRFLDLLKPETGAVLPLLLALEPKLADALAAIVTLTKNTPQLIISGSSDAEPARARQLAVNHSTISLTLEQLLKNELGDDALAEFNIAVDTNQLSAADAIKRTIDWLSEQITTTGTYLSTQRSKIGKKALLLALRRISNDISFTIDQEEEGYIKAAKALCHNGEFSTIIFGHTHLPKDISFASGEQQIRYLNCGTWVNVMQLSQELLNKFESDEQALESYLNDLRDNNLDKYLLSFCSYIEVNFDDQNKVQNANLQRYSYNKPRDIVLPNQVSM